VSFPLVNFFWLLLKKRLNEIKFSFWCRRLHVYVILVDSKLRLLANNFILIYYCTYNFKRRGIFYPKGEVTNTYSWKCLFVHGALTFTSAKFSEAQDIDNASVVVVFITVYIVSPRIRIIFFC